MRRALCAVLAGLCPLLATGTTQTPTTATFAVNATVQSGCWVVGNPSQVSGVSFGMLDFGTRSAISTGSSSASLSASGGSMAQVQCTSGSSVTVTLDAGQHGLGSQRRLKMGTANYIPYALFISSAMATPYPPGVAVPINTSAGTITLPVYGVATPPPSGLPAGQYSDTVQVIFSW